MLIIVAQDRIERITCDITLSFYMRQRHANANVHHIYAGADYPDRLTAGHLETCQDLTVSTRCHTDIMA
jgi:hypothetical protein